MALPGAFPVPRSEVAHEEKIRYMNIVENNLTSHRKSLEFIYEI